MSNIAYYIVKPDDIKTIELIADWYLKEWNIPVKKQFNDYQLYRLMAYHFK
jgi:hypothetical protein